MKKTFDFNINDKVWLMHDNEAVIGVITKMIYKKSISCSDFESLSEVENYILYTEGNKQLGEHNRKELFRTKEDLIKSL